MCSNRKLKMNCPTTCSNKIKGELSYDMQQPHQSFNMGLFEIDLVCKRKTSNDNKVLETEGGNNNVLCPKHTGPKERKK